MGNPGLFWKLDKETQINLLARHRIRHAPPPPTSRKNSRLRRVAENVHATPEALAFFGPEVK